MIGKLYHKFISFIDTLLKYRYWHLYTALFVAIVILFITVPSYFPLTKAAHPCSSCVNFQEKINRADHLFKPTHYPDGDHMAKTQFRLTIPVIAWATGIRSKAGIFAIQEAFGLLFLILTCLFTFRITGDKVIAAITTLSFGFLYAGKAAFADTQGFTDSFAFCFLLIALYTRSIPLMIISLLAAYFTDERAIVSSLILAVFFLTEYLNINNSKLVWKAVFKSKLFYILISWTACFIIRYYLHKAYGLYTPSSGASVINLNIWGYVFWEGLKGFWLIVLGAVAYLAGTRRWFILLLTIGSMVIMLLVTTMVADVTRSVAYIFPVIFLALYFLQKGATLFQIRKLVLLVSIICFLCTDNFYIVGQPQFFYKTTTIKVIGRLFNLNTN